MRQDLLAGASRVLERAGASGFTTHRVAEATGVSVGSVYQYYPDKAALLADLHDDDAQRLWAELDDTLRDASIPARTRFEQVVIRAFEAQAAAREHHAALRSAALASEELPQTTALERRVIDALAEFLADAVPERAHEAPAHAAYCADILFALLARAAARPLGVHSQTATTTARLLANHVGL